MGAVGAQVAPGRVVFEHRAEDHEQRAHAGGERANTRVGQAASTDVGTTGREMLGAHSQHRFRSPHARPSQRLPPFPPFRHSHPCAMPILPSFLRPLRHSCGGRNPCDRPTVRRASIRHSHPSAIPAPPPPFLRPLRHSCGGRNPCDRPTVRRASIRLHPSAIPILPPFLRPLPPFLRRQESIRAQPCPSFRAPSVIPAEAGIHATTQPCDEPPSARRPTRAPSARRVIGRRRTLGVPLTPQIAWIPASAGMTDRRV